MRESESTLSPKSMIVELELPKNQNAYDVLADITASMNICFDITCSFRTKLGPFHAFPTALARLRKKTDDKHSCFEKQTPQRINKYATLIWKRKKVVMLNYPYCQFIIRLQISCHHAITGVSCLELNSLLHQTCQFQKS